MGRGVGAGVLQGKRTLFHLGDKKLRVWLQRINECGKDGLCTAVVLKGSWGEQALSKLATKGLWKRVVFSSDAPWVAFALGKRVTHFGGYRMPLESMGSYLDPRDSGVAPKASAIDKDRVAWSPLLRQPWLWEDVVQEDVRQWMTAGVSIEPLGTNGFVDYGHYDWPSNEALYSAAREVDRHLLIGALEEVLEEDMPSAGRVHPWTIVEQGGKWRLCHDCSVGVNCLVSTNPSMLPSPWDVKDRLRRGRSMVKRDIRDGFFHVGVLPVSRRWLMVRHPITQRLLQCTCLPFGYVASPYHFCGVTEFIAQELRRRFATAGLNAEVFVFVDDFLVTADDEHIGEAERLLDGILLEFGIEKSEAKSRGPAKLMIFLGLALSCVEGHCGIALPEDKEASLSSVLSDWLSRSPAGEVDVEVDPLDLARLLGKMLFASPLIEGSRVHMQSMLAQFAGLVVDWQRGTVSIGREWKVMTVDASFWRDLEWWREVFSRGNAVRAEKAERKVAAISGTDASDWGTGQLVWIDGEREEVQLRFTECEKSHSINWRELLGIWRILQTWGERLAGRLLLIEADNMVAIRVSRTGHSRKGDMQELVLRILEAARRFGIELKLVHTPGALLIRPDLTSRGDLVREPRQRLKVEAFRVLESRFGPFTGFLGAEREFAFGSSDTAQTARLFAHASSDTVGSLLRRLCERRADGEKEMRAVVIVPYAPMARWWSLVKHFSVAGRIPYMEPSIEEMRVEGWVDSKRLRDSIILTFPRAVGAKAMCVVLLLDPGEAVPLGYVEVVMTPSGGDAVTREARLPFMSGTFIYIESSVEGKAGALCMAMASFDPGASIEEETPLVSVVELILIESRAPVGHFEVHKHSLMPDGSPWQYAAEDLWVVSDLCSSSPLRKRGGLNEWWVVQVEFDWRAAEAEIAVFRAAQESEEVVSAEGGCCLYQPLPDAGQQPSGTPGAKVIATEVVQRGSQQACAADGPRCVLCRGFIAMGMPIEMVGVRVAHSACVSRPMPVAVVPSGPRLTASAVMKVAPLAETLQVATSKREALMEEKFGPVRVQAVVHCLSGNCCHQGQRVLTCLGGCGIQLHTVCAMISRGHEVLGRFLCPDCRIREMGLDPSKAKQKQRDRLVVFMLLELTCGSSQGSKMWVDYEQLEKRFVAAYFDGEAGSIVLPRYNAECFKAFLCWVVFDAERAASLQGVVIAASSLMTKLGLTDLTKGVMVKAVVKELSSNANHVPKPQTISTRRIIVELLNVVLPRHFFGFLLERWNFQLIAECVGGLRVGETTGDVHGILANDIQLLRDLTTELTFVDMRVVDSKTGYPRYISLVGETATSHIKVHDSIVRLATASGVELHTKTEGLFEVTSLDFWVLRLSLFGLGAEECMLVERVLRTSRVIEVKKRSKSLIQTMARLLKAQSIEEKKHVNLFGGARLDGGFQVLFKELVAAGVVGKRLKQIPGPFVRSSDNRGKLVGYQSLDPQSTTSRLGVLMNEAHGATDSPESRDPELDLMGRIVAFFRHHANRRFADKVARDAMESLGISKVLIDLHFGWKQREHASDSQLHYAGEGRSDRVKRSKVTMMV